MKLFFISFIFVILCTLHKAYCDSYKGKDVFFKNDCLWVIIKTNHNEPATNISDCRYNYKNKEIYCEFIYDYHGEFPLYNGIPPKVHYKYYYRFIIQNNGIEGKCSFKPGERFKSAILQGYRGNKWDNICLIGNMYMEIEDSDLYFKSPFSTYASKQRFILTTNNGCQIKFNFNKVYARRLSSEYLDQI
ncbi:hypothetical protein PIROE2DRAFT_7858 [Piromyces sp. E2]|nr:hypothetical protein PIROE2DRAFT_7858 [Piromyces sp. E2]|eukprot:OUM65143.1 hypothetical protein PIROE2DRAFT_7858 [Piromyces sp. E2]